MGGEGPAGGVGWRPPGVVAVVGGGGAPPARLGGRRWNRRRQLTNRIGEGQEEGGIGRRGEGRCGRLVGGSVS